MKKLICSTICASLLISSAFAATKKTSKCPTHRTVLKQVDKDHDKALTLAEFKAFKKAKHEAKKCRKSLETVFAEKDKNNDGKVSFEELKRKKGKKHSKKHDNKKSK